MRTRQRELRQLAYIIHIMDNPDKCFDLESYFPPSEITRQKLSNACVEFDSIYPLPSIYTDNHAYHDAINILFDASTRNIINTSFGGINRITSMRYKEFLETLYSMKANISPEQFEFIFALKYDPNWISDLCKKRIKSIGAIYNNGIYTISAIQDREERIKELRRRILIYDSDITNRINQQYANHIVETAKLLQQADYLDEQEISKREKRIHEQANEARRIIEQERLYREKEREKAKMKEYDEAILEMDKENSETILNSKPELFKDNACLNAIFVTTWIYWLDKVCNIPYDIIKYYLGYEWYTIEGCAKLSETRLSIIKSKIRNPIILPTSEGGISLDWHTAIISDFYLMECLQLRNISINEFINLNKNKLINLSIHFGMVYSDIKAAQDCLKFYNDINSAEKVCQIILAIIDRPAITIYHDKSKKGVKAWKKAKTSITADASST